MPPVVALACIAFLKHSPAFKPQDNHQHSWPMSSGGDRSGSSSGRVRGWEVYNRKSSFQRANMRWHIWEQEAEQEARRAPAAHDEAADAATAGTARRGSPTTGGGQQQPGAARGSRSGRKAKTSGGVYFVGLGYWIFQLCVSSLMYLVSLFLLFASITLMRPMALVVALALMLSRY